MLLIIVINIGGGIRYIVGGRTIALARDAPQCKDLVLASFSEFELELSSSLHRDDGFNVLDSLREASGSRPRRIESHGYGIPRVTRSSMLGMLWPMSLHKYLLRMRVISRTAL